MLAGPIYLCAALLFIVVFYVSYNLTITIPLDSINTITGLKSQNFFRAKNNLLIAVF